MSVVVEWLIKFTQPTLTPISKGQASLFCLNKTCNTEATDHHANKDKRGSRFSKLFQTFGVLIKLMQHESPINILLLRHWKWILNERLGTYPSKQELIILLYSFLKPGAGLVFAPSSNWRLSWIFWIQLGNYKWGPLKGYLHRSTSKANVGTSFSSKALSFLATISSQRILAIITYRETP